MLILSHFKPQNALKGVSARTNNKPRLRQGLVVFQFVITIVLIAGTFVIQSQLQFIQHTRLGYEAEHVLTIPMIESLGNRMSSGNLKPDPKRISTVKQKVGSIPGVQNISVAYSTPNGYFTSEVDYQGKSYKVIKLAVDVDYINTMKMKLMAGRNFSKVHATDSTKAIIINETAARLFNLSDKVGAPIDFNLGHQKPILIGIIKDFHTGSLHYPISPTVLTVEPNFYNSYIMRLKAGSIPGVLDRLKSAWNDLAPNYPFSYHFLDDQLQAQYATEQHIGDIFGAFSALAIIIACLGLFGLAAYTAQRRTKEIGVRKVLGATVSNIVGLLSKDFLKLVAIGFVIAVPIAWYAMNRWLADFAYKIEIGPGIFLLAGGLALFIALATLSWQSVRAALANPVDSLRSE